MNYTKSEYFDRIHNIYSLKKDTVHENLLCITIDDNIINFNMDTCVICDNNIWNTVTNGIKNIIGYL